MGHKHHLTNLLKNKWIRLLLPPIIALLLAIIILFLPLTKGTTVHIPDVQNEVVTLSLPLGAEIVQAADGLTITKTATPFNFVDQGDFITYTLLINNLSAGSFSVIFVQDSVPANTKCSAIFMSTDSSGGDWFGSLSSCNGGTALWSFAVPSGGNTFDSGEFVLLSYRVAVTEPLRDQIDTVVNGPGYQVDPVLPLPDPDPSVGQKTVTHIVNAPNWQITKSVVPTPIVEPGETLTYTIVVKNNGHLTTAGTFTITDELPNDTNFVSASPPGSLIGNEVTWVFSTSLDINEAVTVTYAVTVSLGLPDDTLIVNNTYSVTGGNVFSQADGSPVMVTVDTPVTLTLTKLDDPDPVPAGDTLSYQILITNSADSKGPASEVVVVDTFPPANISFIGAGFVGGVNGSVITSPLSVTWIISDPIPIGETREMFLTVDVDSPLPNGTILTNNYDATTSNSTFTILKDPTTVTTTVVSTPSLSIVKVDDPDPILAGQALTYTITYSNSGNANATDVIITDVLDSRVIFGTASGGGIHDGSPLGGNIRWNIGTVDGEGAEVGTLIVTVVVSSPLPNDSVLTNTIIMTSTESITASDIVTTLVNSTPNFRIVKSVSPTPTVMAGELLAYTLVVSNVGNGNGENVVISDVIPLNTTFFTATAGFSPASPTPGNDISWSVPLLAINTPLTFTFVVTVNTPLPNNIKITNSAFITNVFDSETSNTVTTTVVSTPTLEVFKVGLPEPVQAGGFLTYTILYTNTGNANANNVIITDDLPLNTTYFADSSKPNIGPGNPNVSPGSVVWTIVPTLAGNGGSGVITLTVAVTSPLDAGTLLKNRVTIAADEPATDEFTATNTVTSTPVLDIAKVESADPVKAGSTFNYTIIYTNTGNMNATGVFISDIYEGDFAAISASPPGVVSILGPQLAQIIWGIGLVPANGIPQTQVVTVTLPGSVADNSVVTNTATIDSNQNVSDSTTITTTLRGLKADLAIDKRRNGLGDVISGGLITYTITVTNTAGGDTVNAFVTDIFNTAEADFVSCTSGCFGSPTLIWNLGNFTKTEIFTLVLRSNTAFSGTLQNTVNVTLTSNLDEDPDPSNNTFTEVTTVRFPTAELEVNKAGPAKVISGDLITYTITLINNGPDTLNVVLTDTFTAGAMVFNCNGCTGSNPLVWTRDNFTGTQVIVLVLQTLSTFSGTILNAVEITGTANIVIDSDQNNNTDSVTTDVRFPTADLEISKTRVGTSEVLAGGLITYSIVITNNGPDAVDATIADSFPPAEATLVSCGSCSGSNPLTWSVPTFTGTQILDTVILRTAAAFSGTLTNTVQITHTTQPAVDPDNSNDKDAVATPVRLPNANFQISKARIGTGEVIAGDLITYTLTVTNAGGDAADATVTDIFSTNQASLFSCSGCSGSGPITWTLSSFTNTQSLQVVLETSASFSGTLTNTAFITFTAFGIDPDLNDNGAEVGTPVRLPRADLQIDKQTALTQVVAGELVTYTITITNNGPDTTDVVITDTFDPSRAQFFDCSAACTGTGPVSWTFNSFTGTQSVVLILQTSSTFSGTFVNNAQIDFVAEGVDNNPGQENDNAIVPVIIVSKVVYLPIIMKNFNVAPVPTSTPGPGTPTATPTPGPGTPTATPTPGPGTPTVPPTPPTVGPDLVITEFGMSPPNPGAADTIVITVKVQNQGTVASGSGPGDGFWTDFYVNPITLPSDPALGADRRWKIPAINAIKGIGWAVPALAPGEIVTLTSDGSVGIGPTFDPPDNDITDWSGRLPNGSYTFYAFVDSFDGNDPTGPTNVEVVETNENNNLSNPINITIGAGAGQNNEPQSPPTTREPIGPRPDLGQ